MVASDERIAAPTVWRHLLWPLIAMLVGLFVVFADYLAVSPDGCVEILSLQSLAGVFMLVAIINCFRGAFQFLRGRTRRNGLRLIVAFALVLVLLVASLKIGHQVRMKAFAALALRSEPLIEAIKKYELVYAGPPQTLNDLVPEFLARVPQTGMGAYPDYRYYVGKSDFYDGNPWVLIVHASTGLVDFDQFIYYPMQNYPSHRWGNPLEPIGGWVYMHE